MGRKLRKVAEVLLVILAVIVIAYLSTTRFGFLFTYF